MKIVVGLGNPGSKFVKNRHNVGHMVADFLCGIKSYKTDCFMNNSGLFVKKLLKKHPDTALSDLFVVYDDLDIPLGKFKIRFGKGPKNHKGISSINDSLGSKEYNHVRIGVDNRDPDNRELGEDYVLRDFTDEEAKTLKKVIYQVCKKLETL